jgi:hypothetical protein
MGGETIGASIVLLLQNAMKANVKHWGIFKMLKCCTKENKMPIDSVVAKWCSV